MPSDSIHSEIERRLQEDVARIDALGRDGVDVGPGSTPQDAVATLRGSADNLGFASPIDAATHVKRHLDELPAAERTEGTPEHAYHASASRTVREGSWHVDGAGADGPELVFDRVAADPPMAGVTLRTRVAVDSEGQSHLTGHGWPAVPSVPVHSFTGTAEERFLQAHADLADRAVPFDRGMLMLWGVRLASDEPVGEKEPRVRIAENAVYRREELLAHFSRAGLLAEQAGGSSWYAACLYRSELENLFERFLGAVTFSLFTPESIGELDDELAEQLPHAGSNGFALPGAVPSGVPDGHWWWRAPFEGS